MSAIPEPASVAAPGPAPVRQPLLKTAALWVRRGFNMVRLAPHYLLWQYGPHRELLRQDMQRWADVPYMRRYVHHETIGALTFFDLMGRKGQCWPFRSIYYHRMGRLGRLLSVLAKPDPSIHLRRDTQLGPGLFIQHGYDASIGPHRIGRNCWINQQVTIAFSNDVDAPTLGDHVTVHAGARIIGGVHIGDHAVIGAGAVIVKDVPPHCTVVGGHSYIVRRNGVRTREQL